MLCYWRWWWGALMSVASSCSAAVSVLQGASSLWTRWQPLTVMPILFDTEQTAETFCPPAGSCGATSKKSPGEAHDEEEEQKNSTQVFRLLIHQTWHRLQRVNYAAWCSFRSRASGGLAWWSHGRFVWLLHAPPLVVISFYNQHMQIRNGQPINHSWAAEYWVAAAAASKHLMEAIRPQTPRDVCAPTVFGTF